jgi:hypothetical protein
MTIRITQANISGFTGYEVAPPDPPETAQYFMPSAMELLDVFTIDLIVEGVYPDLMDPEAVTYQYATDVRSLFDFSTIGITYSKPNAYTVRLVGPANNIFTNQYYKFKMTDYSEQILPPNTELPFFGLIEYKMPNPTSILKTFSFEADIPADPLNPLTQEETVQFDMSQWFFWDFEVAESNIASITARGLK